MKITVIAKPNSKKEKIEVINEKTLKIYISAPAVDNKANEAIIEVLSRYYKIPKTSIFISKGQKSKIKIVEINEFNRF
ncbi:MAG: DUF167 domain-containing protein [bacterium]